MHALPEGTDARAVVLVEGMSDKVALETLARRRGRDLVAEGVVVLATGGIHAVGRFLDRFGPQGADARLAGLCDEGEESVLRRALDRAGLGSGLSRAELERLGFFVCVADLEDELVRAVGPEGVETVIADEGELAAFRTFQKQPAKRDLSREEQLWRFMWNRKIRYAPLLVEALDLDRVPRALDGVLAHLDETGAPRLRSAQNGRSEPAPVWCELTRGHAGRRTRPSSTTTSPSRSSASTTVGSSTPARCGASATARSAVARRWRNEPSKRDCFRAGSSRVPRERAFARERAVVAARDPREAHGRTEIHQRLCRGTREAMPGASLDAVDVDVAREDVLVEGEVRDGRGRVRADAGKLCEVVGPALGGDPRRGAVERDGATVVAETLPFDDHVGGARGREGGGRRPPGQPALVARHDALHLRLLEHHLGDEDRVRVARPPPREVAPDGAVPREQLLLHAPSVVRRPSRL